MSRSMVHSNICLIVYSVLTWAKIFLRNEAFNVKILRKKKKRRKIWIEKENGISKDVAENSHVINHGAERGNEWKSVEKRQSWRRTEWKKTEKVCVTRLSFVVDRENIDVVNPRTVSVGPRWQRIKLDWCVHTR